MLWVTEYHGSVNGLLAADSPGLSYLLWETSLMPITSGQK